MYGGRASPVGSTSGGPHCIDGRQRQPMGARISAKPAACGGRGGNGKLGLYITAEAAGAEASHA